MGRVDSVREPLSVTGAWPAARCVRQARRCLSRPCTHVQAVHVCARGHTGPAAHARVVTARAGWLYLSPIPTSLGRHCLNLYLEGPLLGRSGAGIGSSPGWERSHSDPQALLSQAALPATPQPRNPRPPSARRPPWGRRVCVYTRRWTPLGVEGPALKPEAGSAPLTPSPSAPSWRRSMVSPEASTTGRSMR